MFKTKNDLPEKSRAKVCKALNQTLANITDLYSQTKQAHWNLRGRLFAGLHKLFDDLAASVEAHIDPTAERITALGGIAQGTVRNAAKNSELTEFPTEDQSDELSYTKVLIQRYAVAANSTRKAIDDCDKAGDPGSADLLTGVSRDLDQALWMLEAHTRL